MPPDGQIQAIMQAVNAVIEIIQRQDRELSSQDQTMLAQILMQAAQKITELRQREGQGAPPIPEPFPKAQYPSSNINSFKYDPKTGRLLVKFMGKDVADAGPVYQYTGVPDFIVDVIARGSIAPRTSGKNKWHEWRRGVTPSHGASVYSLLKLGSFPYKRVA